MQPTASETSKSFESSQHTFKTLKEHFFRGSANACSTETRQTTKPARIEIPSYCEPLPYHKSLQPVKDVRTPRAALGKDYAPSEELFSLTSSVSSTCMLSCLPSPSVWGSSRGIAASVEERMINVPSLRNTYFFDHRSGVGFISIPHLGNHSCSTALGIFRVIESWLEEKLFNYSRVGHEHDDFVPILEENVKSTAAGISNKLEAMPKIFSGLNSAIIHIRTGHVYTLEDGRELVVEEEADDFFQQYPLFLDVSIRFRRCSTSTHSLLATQPSDRWMQRENSKVDGLAFGASTVASSGCHEVSCLEVIAESPLEEGLRQPGESHHFRIEDRPSTCLVVKVTSDIKRFEVGQPSGLSETIEARPPDFREPFLDGRVVDTSLAASRPFVAPLSSDRYCGSSTFPPSPAAVQTQWQLGGPESLRVASDDAPSSTEADVAAEFTPEDELGVFSLLELSSETTPLSKREDGDDDLMFEIEPEGSLAGCKRGPAPADTPRAVSPVNTVRCGGHRQLPRGVTGFCRRQSEDVHSTGSDTFHECPIQPQQFHDHDGYSGYLDGSTVLSSRRTSAADAFDVESEAFVDLYDYYTATVITRVTW